MTRINGFDNEGESSGGCPVYSGNGFSRHDGYRYCHPGASRDRGLAGPQCGLRGRYVSRRKKK